MKKEDEILSAYVSAEEEPEAEVVAEQVHDQRSEVRMESVEQPTVKKVKTTADLAREQSGRPEYLNGSGLKYKDNLGWITLQVESLPTSGLFYPKGTKVMIRAARGNEIKHWSTMNDQDLNQLSQVDDILNYIIEKCVSVEMPGMPACSWKDLKDVDRFYLLLAIREFTFIDGNNDLMVPVSEGKDIPVTKEMIDFIKIPKELMRYYSDDERCFVFPVNTGKLNMYVPSLGSTQWLKAYAQAKSQAREGFDQDFLVYAPMLVGDFRGLTQSAYESMVGASAVWTPEEWSLISNVRDALMSASEPKIKYVNEDGAEVVIPLTFRGGLKSLFLVQNSLFNVR